MVGCVEVLLHAADIRASDDQGWTGSRQSHRVKSLRTKSLLRSASASLTHCMVRAFATRDVLDLAATQGVGEKSGAWFSYKAIRLGQGRENAKQAIEGQSGMLKRIESKIDKVGDFRFQRKNLRPLRPLRQRRTTRSNALWLFSDKRSANDAESARAGRLLLLYTQSFSTDNSPQTNSHDRFLLIKA